MSEHEAWIPGLTHTFDNRRKQDHAYARCLYDALEDLTSKVRDRCPAIPEGVEICLIMADVALIKARREMEKQ